MDAPAGGRDGPAPDAWPVSRRGCGARATGATAAGADAAAGAAAAVGAAANGADAKISANRPSSSMSGVLSSFALPYLLLPQSAPTCRKVACRVQSLARRDKTSHTPHTRTRRNVVFPVTPPVTRPPWRLMSASASSLRHTLWLRSRLRVPNAASYAPAQMRQRASDHERLAAQAVVRAARQRCGIESAHRFCAAALPRSGFADLKSESCQLH